MAKKYFNETYSGWECLGYTKEEAEREKLAVISQMNATRGIQEVVVYVESIGNDKYCVVNKSSYES